VTNVVHVAVKDKLRAGHVEELVGLFNEVIEKGGHLVQDAMEKVVLVVMHAVDPVSNNEIFGRWLTAIISK
jgi:hypothetical protein